MMKLAGGAFGDPQNIDLSKIAKGMSSFVEHESGLDGAEFPRLAVCMFYCCSLLRWRTVKF